MVLDGFKTFLDLNWSRFAFTPFRISTVCFQTTFPPSLYQETDLFVGSVHRAYGSRICWEFDGSPHLASKWTPPLPPLPPKSETTDLRHFAAEKYCLKREDFLDRFRSEIVRKRCFQSPVRLLNPKIFACGGPVLPCSIF